MSQLHRQRIASASEKRCAGRGRLRNLARRATERARLFPIRELAGGFHFGESRLTERCGSESQGGNARFPGGVPTVKAPVLSGERIHFEVPIRIDKIVSVKVIKLATNLLQDIGERI
jgi:hypothetical protein